MPDKPTIKLVPVYDGGLGRMIFEAVPIRPRRRRKVAVRKDKK